jgi:anti-anti-sigma factor
MSTRQTFRFGRVDVDGRPLRDGVMVTVVDDNGATVLAVRSWTEPAPPAAERDDALTVIAAEGDIDLDTESLLRNVLAQTLSGRAAVCCDLSRVTFFGAAAANLLLDTHRHAAEAGQQFFLRGAGAMTEHVLAVADPQRVIARG